MYCPWSIVARIWLGLAVNSAPGRLSSYTGNSCYLVLLSDLFPVFSRSFSYGFATVFLDVINTAISLDSVEAMSWASNERHLRLRRRSRSSLSLLACPDPHTRSTSLSVLLDVQHNTHLFNHAMTGMPGALLQTRLANVPIWRNVHRFDKSRKAEGRHAPCTSNIRISKRSFDRAEEHVFYIPSTVTEMSTRRQRSNATYCRD